MSRSGYTIQGDRQLSRAMRELPANVKREIRPALDKGADEMVAMARSLAPVRDGDLQASIRKEDGSHDLQVMVRAGDRKAWYAVFAEALRPFFWPAIRSRRRRVHNRINRAINAAARRFAR